MILNRRELLWRSLLVICGGAAIHAGVATSAHAAISGAASTSTHGGRGRAPKNLLLNGSFEVPSVGTGIPEWTMAVTP